MKKLLSLIAIAAVASTMFTSCSKDDDKEVQKAKLTLSVEKPTVAIGGTGTFTVKSDINLSEITFIAVTSSNPGVLTVPGNGVTIAQGTKTITGQYVGIAEGTAKITITTTSANATIAKGEVEITVGDAPVTLENLLECNSGAEWSNTYFADEDSFGFTLWYSGQVLLENAGCDYYGADLALTAVEKGADIAGLTMKANPDHILMGTNKSEGYESLPNFSVIGKAQYVVFCVIQGYTEPLFDAEGYVSNTEAFGHDKPQVKGWALVSSDGGGKVILHALKFPATKVGE